VTFLALSVPALIIAFVITVTEMTEVVALVFALSAEADRVRTGALGAIAGTATIAAVALASGAALQALPHADLLGASAFVLGAFGVFMFRSTLKSYRKALRPAGTAAPPSQHALHFAGGFSVGAVEATEAVIVLLALAAGGAGTSALIGAVAGGAVLIVAAALVHERIRRIKVPTLKLGGTSLLFAFAVFWGGEALGYAWPGSDLILIPMFVVAVLLVRGAVQLRLSMDVPVEPKG
jgi:Ca2+/H+ antiporter, TMEM165/GDT1 family